MPAAQTPRRVGVIVGSLRKASINRRLALAVQQLAPAHLHFAPIEIGDLPHFNQDDEGPELPPSVTVFKQALEASDALLFVTPEYNRSIPGVLKNAIDWASRPKGRNSLSGKVAAVCGASLGVIGTAVAQQHLRTILTVLDVHMLGLPEVYVHFTPDLIANDGSIATESTRAFLEGFAAKFDAWIERVAD
jgi:chromate reductase